MTDTSPLVGRDAEERRLAALLADVAGGGRHGAVLLGPTGSGKTALLRRAAALAAEHGIPVASVRVPGGITLPASSLVADLAGKLGGAPPSADGDPNGFGALVASLQAACRRGPVAVLVDDLHWASPEAAAIILSAVRAVDEPLALIAAMRPPSAEEPASVTVPSSSGDLPIAVIDVGPLDTPAIERIARTMLGGDVLPTLAKTLHEATRGNPLHVVEAIRDGRAEGWFEHVAGYWTVGADFRARSVLESIAARIGRLTPGALRVAEVLAVLGRPATLAEIEPVVRGARDDTLDLIEAVAELVDADLAASDSAGTYRLVHALHRTAALQTLGDVRAAAVHGAVLAELRRRDAPAAELAYHATRAATRPDDLPDLLLAAGHAAEEDGEPVTAARWYEALAQNLADTDERRAAALEAAARVTAQFDPSAAIDRYTAALAGASDPARARLLTNRARASQRAGRFDDALADLRAALPLADDADVFSIEAGIGVMGLLTGDIASADAHLTALVERSRDTPNHPRALYHLSALRLFAGDVNGFLALSQEAMDRSADVHLGRSALNNVAWGLMLTGRLAAARALLAPAITEAEAASDVGAMFPLLTNAALLDAWTGEIALAVDGALRSLALARSIGNPTDVATALMCVVLPLVEAATPERVEPYLHELDEVLSRTTELRELGLVYLVAGDAYRALGRLDDAEERCRRAAVYLDLDSVIWSEGVARLEAEIALARGDAAHAVAVLAQWAEDAGAVAIEHAAALEVLGQARFRTRDREGGRALVEQAAERYEAIGARRRAERARRWLAENEIRRPGRKRSTLPAGLTEREIEIVELVVRGRSNREIAEALVLSPATVKTHVERILAKTGAGRRSELAVVAMRLGVLPSSDSPGPSGLHR